MLLTKLINHLDMYFKKIYKKKPKFNKLRFSYQKEKNMGNINAFNHSVTVVAYEKENKKYAATIAWAMQVDYDKVLLLMGSQSVTGKNIMKGDLIGVSTLSKNQKEIADFIGDTHSDEVNKFENISYKEENGVILINNAARLMKVKVIDILHLEGIEEDNLIYGEVIEIVNNNNDFLNYDVYLK